MTEPLKAETPPIPFKCDIHPWMKGYVRVFDHPYFAVTDEDGKFEIKNAPAGKWRIVYWHENGFHKGREGAVGFPVRSRRRADVEARSDRPGTAEVSEPVSANTEAAGIMSSRPLACPAASVVPYEPARDRLPVAGLVRPLRLPVSRGRPR